MEQRKIKASQITNLTDARYFAAIGVEWLGFCLDERDSNHISIESLKEIAGWVDGPKICGEFAAHHEADWIKYMVKELDLTTAQLILDIPDLEIEKILIAQDLDSIQSFNAEIYYSLPWTKKMESSLAQFEHKDRLILQAPDDLKSFVKTIENWPTTAIEVKGGAEEKVGFKSYEELDELFEALEQ